MKDSNDSYPLFSVIIPVFNCEEYLPECIDSILEQGNQNFEIICVDDGSTDGSFQILTDYAKKDSRIILQRQKNSGAGAARNVGLKMARGEYVYFPDGDDICDKSLLKNAEEIIATYRPDVIVFKAYAFNHCTKQEVLMYENFAKVKELGAVFSAEECAEDIFTSFMVEPWNKIFARQFLLEKKLKFQEIARTNDLAFTCSALSLANKICPLDVVLYRHRVGLKNNLQSHVDSTPLDFYQALEQLHGNINKLKNKTFEKSFQGLAVNIIFYNILACKDKKNRQRIIEKIRVDAVPRFKLYKKQLGFSQGQLCDYIVWGDNPWVISKMYGLHKFVEYARATGWKNAIKKMLN